MGSWNYQIINPRMVYEWWLYLTSLNLRKEHAYPACTCKAIAKPTRHKKAVMEVQSCLVALQICKDRFATAIERDDRDLDDVNQLPCKIIWVRCKFLYSRLFALCSFLYAFELYSTLYTIFNIYYIYSILVWEWVFETHIDKHELEIILIRIPSWPQFHHLAWRIQ